MALVTGPAALAQPSAGDSAAGYTVRGQVVNGLNGQPVGRAMIVLNEDFATLTDADGEFAFDRVPGGEYMVSAQKPGYAGFGSGARMHFTSMVSRGILVQHSGPGRRIVVGPDMPALSFTLTPLAMIAGTVSLSTADLPDDIRLMFYHREIQGGRSHWVFAGMAKTRSDGTFRLADLTPGSYLVYTEALMDRPGSDVDSRSPVWGFPSMYYPGVTNVSGAGVISLRAGQQAEADFTLVRQRFFPMTAVVRGDADMPANFEILDSAGRPSGLPPYYDRREQLVHAMVPSGSWSLVARAYGRNMLWGKSDFQITGAPASFAISVLPVPKIPINVRRDFGSSPSGSPTGFTGPGLYLTLESADDFNNGGFGSMRPVQGSNEPDAYEVDVFQPGRYWLHGNAFPPAYISAISSGGVDLMNSPLVVIPGSTPDAIEVTLRNDSGAIAGQVRGLATEPPGASTNSGAQPQVWIYAIPLFPTIAQLPETSQTSGGQFTLSNLAPGSYRVVACDRPQEIDFHSPDGLAAWAGKGQTVTVAAGATANAEVELLHTETAP